MTKKAPSPDPPEDEEDCLYEALAKQTRYYLDAQGMTALQCLWAVQKLGDELLWRAREDEIERED